jgi:hypothetical protein
MTEIKTTSLLLKLVDFGITGIAVYYEGSGDSGAIEYIGYTTKPCETPEDVEDKIDDIWSAPEVLTLLDTNECNELENLVYKILDHVEDWYNNEGGFGTLYVHIPSSNYYLSNNIRIVHTEEFTHEGKLIDLTTKY